MKRAISVFSLAAVTLGLTFGLAGCGGLAGASGENGASGPVETSFNVSDTPPTGVTILRFQIQVTAASLQPSGSQPAVSMLSSPAAVELIRLQSEAALLSNPSVPSGEYTSLSATFANPQMTILNRSNATYTVGGQSCAPNQICTVTPTLNSTMASDESAPFPITLSSASPVGFLLHFDVNASVQGDLSVSPTISLKELPPLPNGALEQFHAEGRITAINSPSFTLQTGFGNLSLSLATTSSTQYQFGPVCAADTFACLVAGEVVRVGVNGMPGGTLDASEVELIAQQGMPALEGVVIGVNTTQKQIQLALMDFQDDSQGHLAAASMVFGRGLTVDISSSTTFNIDTDGITLPTVTPALGFASISDLMLGQTLAVQPGVTSITVTSAPPAAIQISFTANNVRLESSELTATVEATDPPSGDFCLDTVGRIC